MAVGLTVFPAEVCHLSLLQTLSLSLRMRSPPFWTRCKLLKLKWLSLAQNRLSRLPCSFDELESLTVLVRVLDGNEMREFPLVVTGMKALRNLSLRKNSISSIPTALAGRTSKGELEGQWTLHTEDESILVFSAVDYVHFSLYFNHT